MSEEERDSTQGTNPAGRDGNLAHPVSNDAKSKQYRLAIAVIIFAVIVLLLILFFALRSCNRFDVFDSRAEEGQLRGKTTAEIQAEIDREVEEGMFNISIASNVEFQDGSSEGELRIENVPGNQYYMSVQIVDDATGQTLLQTGMIKPNQHIWSHTLDVDLEPGTYQCTAIFTAHDMETNEAVGQAAAKVTIIVHN